MPKAYMVVGLGYGDEGKGSWVDHLVRLHNIRYIFRFNGGAQAAHHVLTPEGTLHRFAQFGSGLFVPNTVSCLSRFMLVDPQLLLDEAFDLTAKGAVDPLEQTLISENAPIIPPSNRLLNRMQEVFRGGGRHGSCGLGIGLTQGDVETLGKDALYMGDLKSPNVVFEKLRRVKALRIESAKSFLNDETADIFKQLTNLDIGYYTELFVHFGHRVKVVSDSVLQKIIRENDTVFEGAQGVLLDQHHGFFPFCTRSNTTFQNAEALIRESGFTGTTTRIGLLRAYGTRHGAGPFVTEDSTLLLPPCDNGLNPWQGQFRLGWFDAVAARYALEVVGGVDQLVITNLDRMNGLDQVRICAAYEEGDPRFFSPQTIHVLNTDYPTLAERTATMNRLVPKYEEFPGWESTEDNAMEYYLEAIEKLVGCPISAYSDSAGSRKVYRNGLTTNSPALTRGLFSFNWEARNVTAQFGAYHLLRE